MPASNASSCCSVLLLSGGRGQRMGGRDKGLLNWRGAADRLTARPDQATER